MNNSFANIFPNSKTKQNLIETDRDKEFYNNFFQVFLNNINIKPYARNISLRAVFAGSFNRTIRDLLKKLVFEKGDSNWIDVLAVLTKQYKNRVHTSTKLAP